MWIHPKTSKWHDKNIQSNVYLEYFNSNKKLLLQVTFLG